MEDLVRKIQSMTLTRTDAEIAEYILAHLSTIGFQTSTTMAEEIGVSDTSVIRFIRKLGFTTASHIDRLRALASKAIRSTVVSPIPRAG